MDQHPVNGSLPSGKERVRLENSSKIGYRGFVVFLICCGLLLAAFAVSSVWLRGDDGLFHDWGSFPGGETDNSDGSDLEEPSLNVETPGEEPVTDGSVQIPEGAIPVRTVDLTYPSLGREYIHNETVYRPNIEALLGMDTSSKAVSDKPLVLILHTHTSESYLPKGTAFLTEAPGNVTYSDNADENVLAVGEELCRVLNEKGITALHCTVMHDVPTLSGAYDRSEETVRKYLETYPDIEYVIDLHRDAIMTSDGAYVRAATEEGEQAVAQVMAVVGSDGNGTPHDGWQGNLALALKLREKLNANGASVCRPVSLRNASFHQELAKHSLLLEIGTGGNTVEEAKRAAVLVGEALAELIKGEDD